MGIISWYYWCLLNFRQLVFYIFVLYLLQKTRIFQNLPQLEKSYWFPTIGLSRPFLKSSQPRTHGCPAVALVSGEAWLSRLLITFVRTAMNTYNKNLIEWESFTGKTECPNNTKREDFLLKINQQLCKLDNVSRDLSWLPQEVVPDQLATSTGLGFPAVQSTRDRN